MKRLIQLISLTRSLVLLLVALLALGVFAWVCARLKPASRMVPAAGVSERVEVPAPLVRKPDAVTVARRVDSSAVEIETVRVQGAERYAATVTVETEQEVVALGVRRVDPGWFSEFRLHRADPVAVDLLPGYAAEVLTIRQRLPLVDIELAPQIGIGVSREGVAGVVALTAVRISGVHLGGYAGAGMQHVSAGGYVSMKPRPGWSVGLGFDVLHHDPVFTLTLNL